MAVAAHEAAHSVLHYALGGRIGLVTIEPSELLSVRAFMTSRAEPADWRDRLVVFAAGPLAEERISRWQRFPREMPENPSARGNDCQRIARHALDRDPQRAAAIYRTAFEEAGELLDRTLIWRAVLDLSGRLLATRRMSGGNAHSIISKHITAGALAGFRSTYDIHA